MNTGSPQTLTGVPLRDRSFTGSHRHATMMSCLGGRCDAAVVRSGRCGTDWPNCEANGRGANGIVRVGPSASEGPHSGGSSWRATSGTG
jgi:hypothetical protein